MSNFIVLTDTHIVDEGELAYGRSDTAQALQRALVTIERLQERLDAPLEGVLVSGDLTDFGRVSEFQRLRDMLETLDLPYWLIPGNHDKRDAMRDVFADKPWMTDAGEIHWVQHFTDLSLIGLDTLVPGRHHGELSTASMDFLDQALAEAAENHVVVATHHPVLLSGIKAMDKNNLHNAQTLIDRLEQHAHPVRVVSGHLHRTMTAQIGRVTYQVVPSTCHSVYMDQREDALHGLIMEPGAATLFELRNPSNPYLTSQLIPTGEYPGPWSFYTKSS